MSDPTGKTEAASELQNEMQVVAAKIKMKGKVLPTMLKTSTSHKKSNYDKLPWTKKKGPSRIVGYADPRKEKQTYSKVTKQKKKFIQRPVDYMWHMGGRLKEIRIRTQARKFLFIWKRKVFGRMTFSEAKQYYKKVICQKCFYQWRTLWWEGCGEWKLMCRADYHYKFWLYRRVWLVWKKYSLIQKQRNTKKQVAARHYALSSYKLRWKQWRMYVQVKKIKKTMYNVGYQKANHSKLKSAWMVWNVRYKQTVTEKNNSQIAALHWATTTIKHGFLRWMSSYQDRIEHREQMSLAVRHSQVNMLHQAFVSWSVYVKFRRKRNVANLRARKFHIANVKKMTLGSIWSRYQARLCFEAKMARCARLSVLSVRRRFFLRWQDYVEEAIMERRKLAIASIHRKKRLLKKTLSSLLKSVAQRKLKIRRNYDACNFYTTVLKVNAWKRWQSKIEEIEEMGLTQMTVIANAHFSINLLKKSMEALKANATRQKLKQRQFITAEAHFAVKALPNCFRRWKKFTQEFRVVNKMKTDAAKFRSDVVTAKYFYEWWSRSHNKREIRTLERMAIMQYNEHLLSVTFNLWSTKARLVLKTNKNDAIARVQYRKFLLSAAIRNWKLYISLISEKRKKLSFAESYYRNSAIAGSWLAWRQYVESRRTKYIQVKNAEEHHSKNILFTCFAAWSAYKRQAVAIASAAELRMKSKRLSLMKTAFTAWKDECRAHVKKRALTFRADEHRATILLGTGFAKWKEWAVLHSYKRRQCQEEVEAGVAVLKRIRLRSYFHLWKKAKNVASAEKRLHDRATRHYESKMRVVAFQAWVLFRYIKLKKHLMTGQSQCFADCRLVRSSFQKWRTASADRDEEKIKTVDALWHWALTLQAKCLDGWKLYVSERKRKKARYADAMDRRRYRMIKEGCIRMLRYHGDVVAMRTKAAAYQKAKISYNAYHLAWKYGKRWIGRVREKKSKTERVPRPFSEFSEDNFYAHFHFSPDQNRNPWIPRPCSPGLSFTAQPPLQSSLSPPEKRKKRASPKYPQFLEESLQNVGIHIRRELGENPAHVQNFANDDSENPSESPVRPNNRETDVERGSPKGSSQRDELSPRGARGKFSPARGDHKSNSTSSSDRKTPHDATPASREEMLVLEPSSSGFRGAGEPSVTGTVDTPSNLVLLPPSAFALPSFNGKTSSFDEIPSVEKLVSGDERSGRERCVAPLLSLPIQPDMFPSNSLETGKPLARFSGSQPVHTPSVPDSGQSCPSVPHHRLCKDNHSRGDVHDSSLELDDTSKTFIASPSRNPIKDELISIHEQLEDFQQLKQRLKVLKQQKQVLQTWLQEGIDSSTPSASLDFGSVETEMQQIAQECAEISQELINRKPIVEKLALRIRVLCSRPT